MATKCGKVLMKPVLMATMPQKKARHGSQTLGVTFFKIKLLGISPKMYVA